MEKYKGYSISLNTKRINCKGIISGHEWTEYKPLKTYTIYGPGVLSCINNKYRSIDKAKEYIDFVIRWNLDKIP